MDKAKKNYNLRIKQLYKIAIFSFLFLFAVIPLFSEDDVFIFYPQPDVISSKFITGIVQDSYGRMWLGTKDGLGCYDGIAYKNFQYIPFEADAMHSSQVQCLYKDPFKTENGGDVLWVGTFDGVEKFDVTTEKFTHYIVSDPVVCCVLRDSKHRLWVGTLNGLNLLDESTGISRVFISESISSYIGNNTIRNVYEDAQGTIYVCTYDGLWEYNEQKTVFVKSSLIGENDAGYNGTVYNIFQDGETYWISVWGKGLLHVNPHTGTRELFSFSDNRIYCMNPDFSKNTILAGTWGGGLISFNKETHNFKEYTANMKVFNMGNDYIFNIFIDNYGSLWIGTNGGGVRIYDTKRMWSKMILPSEITISGRENSVSHIAADKNGNLWMSLLTNGIVCFNTKTGEQKVYKSSGTPDSDLISDSVFCIDIDKAGNIWAGTTEGLCKYDEKTDKFLPVQLYMDNIRADAEKLVCAIKSTGEDCVWIGTYNGGLIKFSPKYGILHRFKHNPLDRKSLCSNLVHYIECDTMGNLWVGTNNGLAVLPIGENSFEVYYYHRDDKTGISSNKVHFISEDKDGKIWIGTDEGGLCVFNTETKKFQTFTTADGLLSNKVMGVSFIDDGYVCVATSRGLSLFSIKDEIIYNYSFYTYECPFTTHPMLIGSLYYVGTQEGLLCIENDDLLLLKNRNIPTKIRAVSINGKNIQIFKLPQKGYLELSSTENNISFEFASSDLSPLSRPQYVYMLKGFNYDWVNAGLLHNVQYTNLMPGRYVFMIKDLSSPNSMHDEFHFVIKAPFWRAGFTIIIYLISCAVFIILANAIRRLNMYKKTSKILKEEQKDLLTKNEKLTELSLIDELTGIGNRREVDISGRKIWKQGFDNAVPVSFIMVDIDFFKQFNDLYGHIAGDTVLFKVAQMLKSGLPAQCDYAGRYGGEEFLIFLYNRSEEEAMEICEDFRKGVEKMGIQHKYSEIGLLTISLGLYTAVPANDCSYEEMLARADEALYIAKKSGRNCIKQKK